MKKFVAVILLAFIFVFVACGCSNNSPSQTYIPSAIDGYWHTTNDFGYETSTSESVFTFELEIAGDEMRIIQTCTHTSTDYEDDYEYYSEYLDWAFDDSVGLDEWMSYEEWMVENYPEIKPVEKTNTIKSVVWHGTYTPIEENATSGSWVSKNLDPDGEETTTSAFGYDTDYETAEFVYKDGQIIYECQDGSRLYEFIFER